MREFAQKQNSAPRASFAHPARSKSIRIQPKLKIGAAGDAYEQEADRIADTVMRMPEPGLQRACACGGGCPSCKSAQDAHEQTEAPGQAKSLQTKSLQANDSAGIEAPPIVHEVLNSPGQPLDPATRAFMEPRFGRDFSQVRVHADARATESAHTVNALAYTVGSNVVFGSERYSPVSSSGKRLLAHELAHAAQQQAIAPPTCIEPIGSSEQPLERDAGAAAPAVTREPIASAASSMRANLATQGVLQRQASDRKESERSQDVAKPCTSHPGCPPDFCKPFSSPKLAEIDRGLKAELILMGIGAKVDSRVLPLWRLHIYGGCSPLDLSSEFANDFTNSLTTLGATDFLIDALKVDLQRYPISFPPGKNQTNVNLWFSIGPEITALGSTTDPNRMNFNHPFEVPGNIAGGIGDDQLSCSVGARPSPYNDVRTADGTADITRKQNGTWFVVPHIIFTVKDTIDLCPGDCGLRDRDALEQVATVPISRWEATGISGDVPFEVNFPSPQCAFSMPAPLGSEPWAPESAAPKPTVPKTTVPKTSALKPILFED